MRWCVTGLLLFVSAGLVAQTRSLHLEIGDPARKGREAPLALDALTDTASGRFITPRDLAAALADTGLIILGEGHTSMEFHKVQLRVIEELSKAGRKVLIGLEMYPYPQQVHLDHWCDGLLTEKGFVVLSHWYDNWGYNWNYYREIFLLARDRGIRLHAVNAPRDVVSAVRKKGFQNLSPEEAAHIPARIDTTNAEHFELFKSMLEEGEGMHSSMSEAQWRAMFDAQCTWDATMAFNAVKALQAERDPKAAMVVLIGSGHAAYGLGIQRQARQWYEGKAASVIPIMVQDEQKKPVETVRASYADFIWGILPEEDPLYPELGVATVEAKGSNRRSVVSVAADSVGKAAGFAAGDVLVSMDGIAVPDRETLNTLMASKRWGDEAEFVVERGGKQVALHALFRRRSP